LIPFIVAFIKTNESIFNISYLTVKNSRSRIANQLYQIDYIFLFHLYSCYTELLLNIWGQI
jgi:hypothetical protein